MNIKYLIALSALGGIGYQSYTRFKNYINNINVSTLNFAKNLDKSFTMDVIISNSLTSIIPYKIAEIKFIDDNNQVIAISESAWDLDKTTNLKFLVPNEDFLTDVQNFEAYFKTLDVEITFNFFLLQHTRKYQQSILSQTAPINGIAQNEVSQIAPNYANNTITSNSIFGNEFIKTKDSCSCEPI